MDKKMTAYLHGLLSEDVIGEGTDDVFDALEQEVAVIRNRRLVIGGPSLQEHAIDAATYFGKVLKEIVARENPDLHARVCQHDDTDLQYKQQIGDMYHLSILKLVWQDMFLLVGK